MPTLTRVPTAAGFFVQSPLVSSQDSEPVISLDESGLVTEVSGVAPISVVNVGTDAIVSVANATSAAVGVSRPDNSTITIAGGVLSVPAGYAGFSQQFDETGSRALGTIYQNTNAVPLLVTVTLGNSGFSGNRLFDAFTGAASPPTTQVGGAFTNGGSNGWPVTITFVVLPGYFYEVTSPSGSGTASIIKWIEWG